MFYSLASTDKDLTWFLLIFCTDIVSVTTLHFPQNLENRFARAIFRNEEGMITRQAIDEQFIIFRRITMKYKIVYLLSWADQHYVCEPLLDVLGIYKQEISLSIF